MIDILKQLALFFTSPLNLVMVTLVLGWINQRIERRVIARRWYSSSLAILVIFSQPYVATLLLYPLEHYYDMPEENQLVNADILFVPACYYTTEGDISEVSRFAECSLQRLVQAAIFSEKYQKPIVVSGGNFLKDKELVYAEKASALLQGMGVKIERIIVVDEGHTTDEEILASRAYLVGRRVVAISSATHGQRLMNMLAAQGSSAVFYPVDFLSSGSLFPFVTFPSAQAIEKSRRAFYEYGARIKAVLIHSDKLLSDR